MAKEDRIHQHVQHYLSKHPEVLRQNRVQRRGEGVYDIDDRTVKVGFCREGFLVVHDGPLRQPFDDYVEKKEATAVYNNEGLKNTNLNVVSKETRISFGDEGNRYSRLDAMKVAKEQANFREKAAQYVNEGQIVPDDLLDKYEKAIDIKLGKRCCSKQQRTPTAPTWWPGTPAAQAAPQSPPAPAPASGPTAARGQQANPLFGQVPDLYQMVAAKSQQQRPLPARVAAPMPIYTSSTVKVRPGMMPRTVTTGLVGGI